MSRGWESRTAACKSMKLVHTLSSGIKINSNTTHDHIKLLEESTDKTFSDINRTHVFLGSSPKATEIKIKISK